MLDLMQVIKASKGLSVKDKASQLIGEELAQEVYGWHVDPSISDPDQAITYLEDAVGKTPAAMGTSSFSYGDWADAFFMPRPCMLRSDGTVAYYLDPNDYTKKEDGTASDVANSSFDGNAMMEWPLIWYKFEAGEKDGEGFFYCSNKQIDSSYKCWCNINSQNEITEHFYTAIYNGTGTSKLRSLSGVQLTQTNGNGNTTAEQEITRALANNTGASVEWYIDVFCDRVLINALIILMGKSLHTQAVFGNGLCQVSASVKASHSTGELNDKGLFYGLSTDTYNTQFVKVFGMENWWGCIYRRTAGLIGVKDSRTVKIKLTYGTADSSTSSGYNATGSGYITVSHTMGADGNGRLKKVYFDSLGYYYPLENNGANHQYWSDGFLKYDDIVSYALFGGYYDSGGYTGANYFNLNTQGSTSGNDISACLSCKPVKSMSNA